MRNIWLIMLLAAALPGLQAQGPKPKTEVGTAGKVETDGSSEKQGVEAGESKQGDAKTGGPKKGDAEQADAKSGDPKKADPKKADPKKGGKPVTETEVIGVETEDPLPIGTDPADLRAMRGAQQMLAAERKLRQLIKSGDIAVDQILTFEEISSWPYEDGLKGMPKGIKKLDGKTVMMTGFMLPIDEVENIKEFLLVQSLWSCCYGQPPDINGIVRVVMKGKKRVDYQFDPIKILGQFKVVATVEDGYCIDVYQLLADSLEVIE